MNPAIGRLYRATLAAALLGAACAVAGCYGEVDAEPAYYPPPSFVATAQPVYFEGHATYWYGGHWVYRDGGGRWISYRSEPPYLAQRRAGFVAPARRTYERPVRGPVRGPERR